MLGISKNALSDYETDKKDVPLSVIVRMLETYHADTYEMLSIYAPENERDDARRIYDEFMNYTQLYINHTDGVRAECGYLPNGRSYTDAIRQSVFESLTAKIKSSRLREAVAQLNII